MLVRGPIQGGERASCARSAMLCLACRTMLALQPGRALAAQHAERRALFELELTVLALLTVRRVGLTRLPRLAKNMYLKV